MPKTCTPDSRCEPGTPALSTPGHSGSLHSALQRGSAERKKKKKKGGKKKKTHTHEGRDVNKAVR